MKRGIDPRDTNRSSLLVVGVDDAPRELVVSFKVNLLRFVSDACRNGT